VLTRYARHTIVQVAWDHGIPVQEVAAAGDIKVDADILVVACFDRLIPRETRSAAKLAVNIHPSLLPDNRGPAPLFWTFRLGRRTTGVTVHLLEDKPDAGAILAQREVPVPDGIDGVELEQQLASLGGELLVQVIRDYRAGQLQPRPQDETRATSHPWPSPTDWTIPFDWAPQRVFNFRRGTDYARPSDA